MMKIHRLVQQKPFQNMRLIIKPWDGIPIPGGIKEVLHAVFLAQAIRAKKVIELNDGIEKWLLMATITKLEKLPNERIGKYLNEIPKKRLYMEL